MPLPTGSCPSLDGYTMAGTGRLKRRHPETDRSAPRRDSEPSPSEYFHRRLAWRRVFSWTQLLPLMRPRAMRSVLILLIRTAFALPRAARVAIELTMSALLY